MNGSRLLGVQVLNEQHGQREDVTGKSQQTQEEHHILPVSIACDYWNQKRCESDGRKDIHPIRIHSQRTLCKSAQRPKAVQ